MSATNAIYCPACEAANEPDAIACTLCGHQLAETEKTKLAALAASRNAYRAAGLVEVPRVPAATVRPHYPFVRRRAKPIAVGLGLLAFIPLAMYTRPDVRDNSGASSTYRKPERRRRSDSTRSTPRTRRVANAGRQAPARNRVPTAMAEEFVYVDAIVTDSELAAWALAIGDGAANKGAGVHRQVLENYRLPLDKLSRIYREDVIAIGNMTIFAQKSLKEKGLSETSIQVMRAMRAFDARLNSPYAEMVAMYIVFRTGEGGVSHDEAILNGLATLDGLEEYGHKRREP